MQLGNVALSVSYHPYSSPNALTPILPKFSPRDVHKLLKAGTSSFNIEKRFQHGWKTFNSGQFWSKWLSKMQNFINDRERIVSVIEKQYQ